MPRTIYLSRLLGLFFLTLAATEITRGSSLADAAMAIVNAPALLLISGMLTLVAGLAIVLSHNVWRGGAMAVVVTIVGWAMLIKGAALLLIPPGSWLEAVQDAGFMRYYAWYGIPTLLLGGFLTFAGFRTERVGKR